VSANSGDAPLDAALKKSAAARGAAAAPETRTHRWEAPVG